MIRLTAIVAMIAYTGGLHWIYISLHDYGLMPAWLAVIATLLLAAYVSLFVVGAVAVIRWLKLPLRHPLTPFAAAAVITLFEWLRGTLLTGFPWLAFGYLVIDTPLAGFASVIGVYGVGFLAIVCVLWLTQAIRWRNWFALAATVTTLAGGFVLGHQHFTQPHGKALRVALVQGAIPQSMKFDPARETQALQTHLELARTAAVPGGAQLIVFPETAMVRPWTHAPAEFRDAFSRLARQSGSTVMLGLPLHDPDGYRNSLIAISPTSKPDAIDARYDKHHLVPFGEFIPLGFRWFVDMMKMPLGDFQRGLPVQPAIAVADQHIAVNICFEDLFGEEIIRPIGHYAHSEREPNLLLNISNLAWFGDTIALSQHLDIARMRSLETGRPTIRATNTGVTAAIDHRGRVMEQLPRNQQGLLFTQVQGMQGITPFTRFGNLPVLMLSVALILGGLLRRLRTAQ